LKSESDDNCEQVIDWLYYVLCFDSCTFRL